jgi:surface polysaccharide O-acyltransferase-like enzyme
MTAMPAISTYLSVKISILTFFSIVLVILLHSYNLEVHFDDGNMYNNQLCTQYLEEFVSNGVCRLAVPLLFCISGFLFFKSNNYTLHTYPRQLQKRVYTLLIPYLIWSIWGIVFYYSLQLFPGSYKFFTKDYIADFGLYDYIDKIWIHPIPYQLWFIRDLMILVLIAPIIYIAIKHLHAVPVLILLAIWFYNINTVLVVNEGLLFFTIGAFIALKNIRMRPIPGLYIYLTLLSYIMILFVKTSLHETSQFNTYYKISILIGLPCIWALYDKVIPLKKIILMQNLIHISSYSFFLYLFHEPFLTIIKKGLIYIQVASLFVYFSTPTIVIIISLFTAYLLKKNFGKIYIIIAGGR